MYIDSHCCRKKRTSFSLQWEKEVFIMFLNVKASSKEMKKVTSISGASMLMGLKAILAQFTYKVSNLLEIGFSSCVTGVCAMYYGPVLSAFIGFIADHVEFLLRPSGPYFPGFAINEMVIGFVYGCFFYKKTITFKRVLAAQSLVTILVNLLLTPIWLSILYGNTFWAIWIGRLGIQAIRFPIDLAILYFLLKAISNIRSNR